MGDRRNVFVDTDLDGKGIYLYIHWGGKELPKIVQIALKKKWRWSDPAYLSRIIFCEMIKDDLMGETGFGISSELTDYNRDTIKVLTDIQEVHIGKKEWTFEEYINDNLENIN